MDTNSDLELEDEQPQEAKQLLPVHRLDTGISHLPFDIRLEIYKAAFPEMLRTLKKNWWDDKEVLDSKQIRIQYRMDCWLEEFWSRRDVKASEEDIKWYLEERLPCICGGCISRRERDDQLTKAIRSHFTRDPTTRNEFLSAYVKSVQFRWSRIDEQWARGFTTLLELFEILRTGGLISCFSHLTIVYDWRTRLTLEGPGIIDDNFEKDVEFISGIFSVLHAYKIKAEITMTRARPWLGPFLARIKELCKTHLRRQSPMSIPYMSSFLTNRQSHSILWDEELRKIVEPQLARDEAWIEEDDYRYDKKAWCYKVDFSDQDTAN
ncbi:hypothetical protein BKA63DRAFT_190856 [Paraphoma chrysanthemicola]|nr:hypothetical protein BKA63DRAFT_190856 [Paraphoma chrysanthemicola]